MNKIKRDDLLSILLMVCFPAPVFFYYSIHLYTGFSQNDIIGKNICVLIAAVFLWGMADILYHYISIVKEAYKLECFGRKFTANDNMDHSGEFKDSIIDHRYQILLSLRNSLSDIKHEALTEIISSRESTRAVMAKYFIGACVMLGLLGSFLGLLKTVGGAYSAIESISNSQQLLANLHSPLSGMSLTFSTSIIGIIASLSLGFAFIFLNRRQIVFLADLEEFTQTSLIPGLSISSGKRIDDILDRLAKIEANTESFLSLKQEITKEAETLCANLDSSYSRLSLSVEDGMNNTMHSIKKDVSGSFNSLTDSTAKSIKSLADSIDRSIIETHNSTSLEIREFVSDEKELVHEILKSMKSIHQEEIESTRHMQKEISTDIKNFLENEKSLIYEMTEKIGSTHDKSFEAALLLQNNVSDSIEEFLGKEKEMITLMIDSVGNSSESSVKAAQQVLKDYSEKNHQQMEDYLASVMNAYKTSVDNFMEKWSRIFKEQITLSSSKIQEKTHLVYEDALNKNRSILKQNMELFNKTSLEFKGLGSELEGMHETYQERLNQTTDVLNEAVQGFRTVVEKEQQTNNNLTETNTKTGELLEEVALLLNSSQAEMNASLAMFSHGIDTLLQAFQVKSVEKEKEQTIVFNLEKSLNELTEKSGDVLHEYAARSREIYSGLLENQLHLTRKIEEISNGQDR